jgi:RNase P/RNase MRP subunit p29
VVVKRSKNASLVGIEGIVVVETAETFKVVTIENVIKGASAQPDRRAQLIVFI